jgi:hypothetical protein
MEGAVRKSIRMFLVLDPPEQDQGKWATDAVSAFDSELRKYIGFMPRSPLDGGDGQKGGE